MADEIKIPCLIWRHPTRNANAYEDVLTLTNNEFVQRGIVFPDNEYSRLCFKTSEIIRSDYVSTPKLRITWKTASTDTSSNMEFEYEIENGTPGTDAEDPSTWTIDSQVQDINAGAGIPNFLDISLSSLTGLAVGDNVYGTIARDAQVGNGQDTLAAAIMVESVVFLGSTS